MCLAPSNYLIFTLQVKKRYFKLKKVKKVISDIIEKSDYVIDKENVIIALNQMSDSSLIYTVKVWVNTNDYWNAKWYFMENIKSEFDKNHIEIPYPQLDIHQK